VCLRLARRAIEEFKGLARTKQSALGPRLSEQVQAQVALARAEALVRSARSYWYDEVQAVWHNVVRGCESSLQDRAATRLPSMIAVEQCVAAIDLLYRLAGSSAIFQSWPLERCWRDVHTGAAHSGAGGPLGDRPPGALGPRPRKPAALTARPQRVDVSGRVSSYQIGVTRPFDSSSTGMTCAQLSSPRPWVCD
jgi:alkylation response protein AidB-like acyl-CoA dehydrogenase